MVDPGSACFTREQICCTTPVASPAAGLLNTAVVVTGTVGASRHALLSSGAAAAETVGTVTKATAAIAEKRSRALSSDTHALSFSMTIAPVAAPRPERTDVTMCPRPRRSCPYAMPTTARHNQTRWNTRNPTTRWARKPPGCLEPPRTSGNQPRRRPDRSER